MSVEMLVAAARRGADWLTSQQDEDGSLWKHKGLDACFKAPWALLCTGHITEASRLLDWVRDNAMPRPGDFYLPKESAPEKEWRFYRNAYFLLTAQKLGRFDIASGQAIERMLEYQHSCGGFLGNVDDMPSRYVDTLVTCLGGWASLYLGRQEAAIRAAEFLIRVMDAQPEISSRFYIYFDPETAAAVTEFPPDSSISYYCDIHRTQQHFFFVGAPMGFLADVYKRSGDARFRQAALRYFHFESRTNPAGFSWPSKCKSGWGAALLYSVTGDPAVREIAERVAHTTFLESQLADGSWQTFRFPTNDDHSEFIEVTAAEMTAEFVFELTEIARCLA